MNAGSPTAAPRDGAREPLGVVVRAIPSTARLALRPTATSRREPGTTAATRASRRALAKRPATSRPKPASRKPPRRKVYRLGDRAAGLLPRRRPTSCVGQRRQETCEGDPCALTKAGAGDDPHGRLRRRQRHAAVEVHRQGGQAVAFCRECRSTFAKAETGDTSATIAIGPAWKLTALTRQKVIDSASRFAGGHGASLGETVTWEGVASMQ
jgi:hypothetical protein